MGSPAAPDHGCGNGRPSSAFLQLGATRNSLGQPEAAIPYIEKAIRLSPYDASIPVSYMVLGRSHLLLGHLDQAVDLLSKARAANPRLYLVHFGLAAALGLKGDLDEARAALAGGDQDQS